MRRSCFLAGRCGISRGKRHGRCAAARDDVLTPAAFAIAAYEKARQPKRLEILPGGHFDAYVKGFDASSAPALSWFREHLAV